MGMYAISIHFPCIFLWDLTPSTLASPWFCSSKSLRCLRCAQPVTQGPQPPSQVRTKDLGRGCDCRDCRGEKDQQTTWKVDISQKPATSTQQQQAAAAAAAADMLPFVHPRLLKWPLEDPGRPVFIHEIVSDHFRKWNSTTPLMRQRGCCWKNSLSSLGFSSQLFPRVRGDASASASGGRKRQIYGCGEAGGSFHLAASAQSSAAQKL